MERDELIDGLRYITAQEPPKFIVRSYRAQLRRLYGASAASRTRITVQDGTVTIRAWDLPKGKGPITLPLEELPRWTKALSWRTPIRKDKQNNYRNMRRGPEAKVTKRLNVGRKP